MKLHQTTEKVSQLVELLEIAKTDAFRFDNGNNKAGLRTRKVLCKVLSEILALRKAIQKTRYYREALAVYSGRKAYIEKLEYKEKKYGPVDKVAKLQIIQNRKNRAMFRN